MIESSIHAYKSRGKKRFVYFGWATVSLIYLLILAGGIVRATESGMGCPDWPKCFGQWIPPVVESELPRDYKKLYALKGYEDVEFNPLKTWIEYINRLLGVLVGLCVLLFFVYSLFMRSYSTIIPLLSGIAFILVAFQGWLGSVVVSTVLREWIITAHMVLALVIVLLVQYIVVFSKFKLRVLPFENQVRDIGLIRLSWLCVVVLLVQVVLGTQVREQIDMVAKAAVQRAQWIEQLGLIFVIHRSFSILVLAILMAWIYRLHLLNAISKLSILAVSVIVLIEVLAGMGLAYAHVPAILQPIHLVFGSLLLGVVGYLFTQYVLSVRFSSLA